MLKSDKQIQKPSFLYALTSIIIIFIILISGTIFIGARLDVMIFISLLISIPLGMKIGYSYEEVESFALDMIRGSFGVIMILIAVGALIGTWIASGTISVLTNLGLQLIEPHYFLITSVLICSLVSVLTGTSWGTLGSVGVALITVAHAFDIHIGLAAGAIICGSIFGDKLSPFSDTTNLAAATARVDLIEHIKFLMWTTTPAYLLTLLIFFIIGFNINTSNSAEGLNQIESISNGIISEFNTGIITVLPLVVVIVLLMFKMPAFPAVSLSAVVGAIIAIFYQNMSLVDILNVFWSGFESVSENELVDTLLTAGGIENVLPTVLLFILTLGLGGVLNGTGILNSLFDPLLKIINTPRKIIPTTLAITYINCGLGASSNFAYSVVGPTLQPIFKRLKLDRLNLSRAMEDAGAVAATTIPWNITAVFAAGILGVSQAEFIPFLFLSFLSPLVALVYALFGFSIKREEPDNET